MHNSNDQLENKWEISLFPKMVSIPLIKNFPKYNAATFTNLWRHGWSQTDILIENLALSCTK